MQPIKSANLAARGASRRAIRDLMIITVKNRSTGADKVFRFHSGAHDDTFSIFNPDTGNDETYAFKAAGAMIAVSQIPRVSNLTVQTVTIEMSGTADEVNQLFREYDARNAKVELYRCELDSFTKAQVEAAEPRFLGFVDTLPIRRPEFGGDVKLSLKCKSHSQELTRANYAKVSTERAKIRNANDNFFDDVASVGEWEVYLGLARES